MCDDNERVFSVPMKVKRLPLRRCEECSKRKLSTTFYEVHDTGLNTHIDYNVCKKCMKEARERVKRMPKCSSCEDIIDGKHETLCNYCFDYENWKKEVDKK